MKNMNYRFKTIAGIVLLLSFAVILPTTLAQRPGGPQPPDVLAGLKHALEEAGALRQSLPVAQAEHRGALHNSDEPGFRLIGLAGAAGVVALPHVDVAGRRSGGPSRTAAEGEELRQEGHDDYGRASSGSERLPGFHEDRVAER